MTASRRAGAIGSDAARLAGSRGVRRRSGGGARLPGAARHRVGPRAAPGRGSVGRWSSLPWLVAEPRGPGAGRRGGWRWATGRLPGRSRWPRCWRRTWSRSAGRDAVGPRRAGRALPVRGGARPTTSSGWRVWCREHTPADARFIGPPGPKTFRLWSLRSLAFNRAGSPYHAAGLADWAARFRDHVGFDGPDRRRSSGPTCATATASSGAIRR